MTRAARRLLLAGTAWLALGLPFVTLPATAQTPAPPPSAAPVPGGPATDQVRVVIDGVTPAVPRPGGTLTLAGRLTVIGREPVDLLRVRLRAGSAPLDRSEVAAVATGSPPASGTRSVRGGDVPVAGRVQPGATVAWSLTVATGDLGFEAPGAYALAVLARSSGTDGERRDVGLARTLVPWSPAAQPQPTRLVWLWPLVDSPGRDASGTFLDDHLATDLAPNRPLGGLPAAAGRAGVTWAVDPDLLSSARAMTRAYRVRRGTGTIAGTGSTAAAAWLATAQQATASGEVVALGYADPDAVALQRAGLSGDLTSATTSGPAQVRDLLGRPVVGDVAWPAAGLTDGATLETLRAAGAHAVVVSDTTAPASATLTFTPSGRATLPSPTGPVDGLLVDTGLSQALATRFTVASEATLATQRLLADLLTVSLQRPNDPRTLLVAPPRRWRPQPALAARLVATVAAAPWVRLVPLTDLRAAQPTTERDNTAAYPQRARTSELPPRYLRTVATLRADLRAFGSILDEPTAETGAFDAAILRTESSAWRSDRTGGRRLVGAVRTALDARRSRVHLVVRRDALLTGARGTLSVSVANELDEPVVVGVRVTPDNRARLVVREPAAIKVAPRTTAQVRVQVRAVAAGPTSAQVQLVTRDGLAYGSAQTVRIDATAIGRVSLLVTGGALAVFCLAAGIRVARRVRARRHPVAPPAPPAERVP